MKRWCRVADCYRAAAPGSEFCGVKHGWSDEPVIVGPEVSPGGRRMKWTRDRVVAAIDLWASRHGRQPTQKDWDRAGVDHPTYATAAAAFGSWGAALTAAGFTPGAGGARRKAAA